MLSEKLNLGVEMIPRLSNAYIEHKVYTVTMATRLIIPRGRVFFGFRTMLRDIIEMNNIETEVACFE